MCTNEKRRKRPWWVVPFLVLAVSLALPLGGGIVHAAINPIDCSQCHTGSTLQSHHSTSQYINNQCSYCHLGVTTTGDCSSCHVAGVQNTHHASAPALAGNCAQCHTNVGDYKVCLSCHGGATRNQHHAAAKTQNIACTTCHTAMVSGSGCETCHTTPVKERHHNVATTMNMTCAQCHPGIVLLTDGCKSCHTFLGDNAHHTSAVDPYGLTCASCHTTVWNGLFFQTVSPTTDQCKSCHTTVVGQVDIVQQHHMTVQATSNQCTYCHQGITPVTCSNCHGTTDSVTRHHSTELYASGACTSCHVGAEGSKISCATCHAKPPHHQSAQALSGDCTYCHSTIQTNGTGCKSCHIQPIKDIHHGAPLANVGGNCSVCHQTTNDPTVCSNCHQASPHHTTTWSQQGDCAHCHKVPADVLDRPQQAACRECHGAYKHDKGGPIQNFGACAACHSTIPFHAKPLTIPGYTGYGAGKKKFNLFWSQYAIEEGPGEALSPNGEDMNDEGGFKIKAQQLAFNKVQISSGGRTYTVPSFDTTAPVSLTTCTKCHVDRSSLVSCSNTKWTSHLTLNRVDLATYQLAESTYLGSLCSSSTGTLCTVVSTGTYIEAENYNVLGTNFSVQSATSGVNGGKYIKATVSATSTPSGTPVSYALKFGETGTYYLWFRGNDGRSTSANSLWYGLNNVRVGDIRTPAADTLWRWVNARDGYGPTVAAITVTAAGTHTLNIWAKDSNFQLDGIYITKANTTIPGGTSVTIPTGSAVVSPVSCGGVVSSPTAPVNLALNKPATATRQESGYEATKAVDGNAGTRWWAKSTSSHSIRVDLGSAQTISKVSVNWYSYYATSYQVHTSTDGSNWTSVASVSSSTGGTRDHTFTARSARYVRIYCTKASSSNGYSINELSVFK